MDYGNLRSIAFPHFPENTDFVSSWGEKRPLGHQGEVPRRAYVPGARFKIEPERGGVAPHSKRGTAGTIGELRVGAAMLTPRVSGGARGKKAS